MHLAHDDPSILRIQSVSQSIKLDFFQSQAIVRSPKSGIWLDLDKLGSNDLLSFVC